MPMTINDTFLHAVNAGLVPGHKLIRRLGRNAAASTSVQDIMFGGGVLTPLTSAVTMEAISASVNDTAAGSNARTIQISGVNNNFDEITEIITMNGTSATTATTQKFLRVNNACVETTGTYNTSNTGDITIRVSSAGATQIIIEAVTSISQSTHFTVPKNQTGFLLTVRLEVDSSKSARIMFLERDNLNIGGAAPFGVHKHSQTWDGITGSVSEDFMANHIYIEKTDLWAESIAGQNGTALEFDYDLLLIDKSYL